MAAEGARTVVADLNADGAKQVAEAISAAGGEATAVQADLADVDSVRAMVEAAVTAYGGLDILHNNAAATILAATKDLPVSAADPDVWDETMRVNLRGALVAIQAAVPHMIARGGGSVINTASGAGLTGDLRPPAYGASKAALVSLTRYVAVEFGKQGIRCNAISPGFIVIGEKRHRPRGGARDHAPARAHPPPRPPGGHRRAGGLPGLRRIRLHHRAEHLRRRRHARPPAVPGRLQDQ